MEYISTVLIILLAGISFASASSSEGCDSSLGAEASRRFCYELYAATVRDESAEKNIFIAPIAVATGLAMIYAGADGMTKNQIWRGLELSHTSRRLSEKDLPCLFEAYNPAPHHDLEPIPVAKDKTLFRTVSRMFGERSYSFNRAFINKTREYGEKLKRISFSARPDACRRRINHWVSKMTNEKINDLFSKEAIDENTKIAIVSVVYFNGPWKTAFASDRKRPFRVGNGDTVQADFMMQDSAYKYCNSEALKASLLELPYRRNENDDFDISMIIISPSSSMDELEYRLTEANMRAALSQLFSSSGWRRYEVHIPKFEITADYDMKPILTDLGMRDMFDQRLADLSNMIARDTHTPDLYVSEAVHKTFIKVDEIGTEAAGAAGFAVSARMIPTRIFIDQPFITLIYEKNSETILFIGKVNDPTSSG